MAYTRIEIPKEKIEAQEAIAARLAARWRAEGKRPLALVDTYGCQQNESDSERIRGYLAEMGCDFTSDEARADIIVINTCAVREHAEQRVLGNVGNLLPVKREKPDQLIILCGCMVQQRHMAEKIKRSYPLVNLVFGPHELWRFPELIEQVLDSKKRVFAVTESDGAVAEGGPRRRDGSAVKAWLSVMYGCNNFCTYCVVPHVRGRERSRRPEEVVAEARALVDAGYKDITLLGQNVNSYGKDFAVATTDGGNRKSCDSSGSGGADFADLLRMVNDIPGKFILRFMTSHPKDATEKLFQTMAECEKCAHHIHLPVQAGSDRVLAAMNRGYTASEYLEKVALARKYMPDIALTTDIIVGFPGETNAEFEATLGLVETVRYDSMFTFIYSPRVGTKAASLPDPMTRAEKQVNFDRLIELSNHISGEKHAEYVGKTVEVLVDGENRGEEYPLTSRTKTGRLVHLKGDRALIGHFVRAYITDSATWALFGEIND